jgi:hypothetical protein
MKGMSGAGLALVRARPALADLRDRVTVIA